MAGAATLAAMMVLAANAAMADVFGSDANQFTLSFVPISGATHPTSGYGIVDHDYRMGTYEITNDLETVGCYDFGGKLNDSMTAHPKICPTTGEMHFFGYGNIFEPHVTYHRANADGELTVNRPLEVKALTMMHDFALTEGHVIFMDLPIVFNLDVAINNPDAGVINAPYGGFKESGTGYEHGPEGLEQYLRAKHVRIRFSNRTRKESR